MRNAEFGMRKVEGGKGNGEVGMRKAEFGMGKSEGGRWKAEGGIRKADCKGIGCG